MSEVIAILSLTVVAIVGMTVLRKCLSLQKEDSILLDRKYMQLEKHYQTLSLQLAEHHKQAVSLLTLRMEAQQKRLDAYDREIDLTIQDIPKRIDQVMQMSVAKYSKPFKEADNDTKNKPNVDGLDYIDPFEGMPEVSEEEFEKALLKYEAGIGR